jgi:hypothetical protein
MSKKQGFKNAPKSASSKKAAPKSKAKKAEAAAYKRITDTNR